MKFTRLLIHLMGLIFLYANTGIFANAQSNEVTPPNTTIAFIGDSGVSSGADQVLQLIIREGADAVLHSGDLDYVNDPDTFFRNLDNNNMASPFPYIVGVGNHEVDLGDNKWYNGYQLLAEQRMRDAGVTWEGQFGRLSRLSFKGINILLLAPGLLGTTETEITSYINSKLANSNAIWNICSWHYIQRSYQIGGKSDRVGWGPYEACNAGGALIANAHEHSYSRTHSITHYKRHQYIDAKTSMTLDKLRTFQFVSGLGGISIRDDHGASNPWIATRYSSTQGANYGALFGVFNYNGQADKARFYFKSIDGNIVDDWIVTSQVNSKGPFTIKTYVDGAGTVVVDPVLATYPKGTSVTFMAEPIGQHIFKGWSGSLNSPDNPTSVIVNGNMEVSAEFIDPHNPKNLIQNPGFTSSNNWQIDYYATAAGQFSTASGVAHIGITNGATETWHIQLKQAGLEIEQGADYVVKFDARADSARTIVTRVGQGASPYTAYSNDEVHTLSSQTQTYTYRFNMKSLTDANARIEFNVGGQGTADVIIDNVSVKRDYGLPQPTGPFTMVTSNSVGGSVTVEPALLEYPKGTNVTLTAIPDAGYEFERWSGSIEGVNNPISLVMDSNKQIKANFSGNLIKNGDFNAATGWVMDFYSPSSGSFNTTGGTANIIIDNAGTESWNVQFKQAGLKIENGKRYVVKFDAKAGAARSMITRVGQAGTPYTAYSGDHTHALNTNFKTFNYVFTMSSATDSNARFEVNLGAGGTADVVLDNVSIRAQTGIAAPVNHEIISSSTGRGSVQPEGKIVVSKERSQTFKFVPDSGYVISDVSIDGDSVGVVSEYTFTNVRGAHRISATFIAQSCTNCIGIPGRIEAEDYRSGGEGTGYHDSDTANKGGAYRNDGVDIEATGDANGSYNIGWTKAGEWLAYDINVIRAGSYRLSARLASPKTSKMRVEIDGADVTGSLTASTGDWQKYTLVEKAGIALSAGKHQLRIVIEQDDLNINYLELQQQ